MRQDDVIRHLTGLTRSADTSYDVRIDDDRFWIRDLAASHGADSTTFPCGIKGDQG